MNEKIESLNLLRDKAQDRMRTLLEESFFLSIELDKDEHRRVMDDITMWSKILWRLDVRVLQELRRAEGNESI